MAKAPEIFDAAFLYSKSIVSAERDKTQVELWTCGNIQTVYSDDLREHLLTDGEIIRRPPELVFISVPSPKVRVLWSLVRELREKFVEKGITAKIAVRSPNISHEEKEGLLSQGVDAWFDEQESYESITAACVSLMSEKTNRQDLY
jgi:hypothetical protein